MKVWWIAVVVTVVAAGAAWADHQTPVASAERGDGSAPVAEPRTGEPSSSLLDMEIKVDKEGFRIGGRRIGPGGVAGAWLNGQLKANGFVLDGRVQDENGQARNFKLDAEVRDWLTRTGWQWWLGRFLAD
jgi:hypothetical protein